MGRYRIAGCMQWLCQYEVVTCQQDTGKNYMAFLRYQREKLGAPTPSLWNSKT